MQCSIRLVECRGRQLVLLGPNRLTVDEAPSPAPRAGEVVLEVVAAGVCGSDVHGYMGVNARRPPGTVMGHEVTGQVLDGGDTAATPGQSVAVWPIAACGACASCRHGRAHLCEARRLYGCTPELAGGFATTMTVPAENLVPVPTGVPPEWGALVEPLAVGHHAVAIAGVEPRARLTVLGGGPIGIAAAIAARRLGVEELVVVEPLQRRREKLAALGLPSTTPDEAPQGVDVVVECVGHAATVRAAIAASRPGGTIVCVGIADPEVALQWAPVVIEERRLLGSSAYTLDEFRAVAASLAAGDVDFGLLIERRVGLDELPGAFADYAAGDTSAIKTVMVA
jgi:2-desacetyl-2-hydroxyethyl bacteriochlorophyllide A dehydrogenase